MNAIVILRDKKGKEKTFKNVTRYSVGFRLVYLEYSEDGEPQTIIGEDGEEVTVTTKVTRTRAFGRTEFESLYIMNENEDVIAKYPLDGDYFTRINC